MPTDFVKSMPTLKIDNIDRFIGYNLSTNKSVYMVTKEIVTKEIATKNLSIAIKKKKNSIKAENKKKRFKRFLLFIISRLFVNISFSQIKTTNQIQIYIIQYNYRTTIKIKYKPFISVLNCLIQLEKVVTQVLTNTTILTVSKYNPEEEFNIADFDYVNYNSHVKYDSILHKVVNLDNFFKTINYQEEVKEKKEKTKFDSLLKDKELMRNFLKGFILNRPQLKKKRTLNLISKIIRRGKIIRLISFVIRKLARRRRYLWRHVDIILNRNNKLILIGKDYKIYKKKIGKTYISQESKYFINRYKKKRLNVKHIKCVELIFKKPFLKEFKRFFKYILYVNKILHYFLNRFHTILYRYSAQLSDKKFTIPLRGKISSFTDIMSRFLSVNYKGKKDIMLSILLMRKHIVEKQLLKSLQKKKERSLEKYIRIMEREKYYPKHRRTQIPLRIKRWLMKHVYDDMDIEFKEYYSRPRVILEKREELVSATYPYLPRKPLKFQRDIDRAQFKRFKPIKYRIIRLTRPKVILQTKNFNYYKTGKYLSKNLVRTKLNSKVHVLERVRRILSACKSFYKNLLKGNSYQHYLNLIKKFKILYLYKPHLTINKFIVYILLLSVSPIFRGIWEERDYAHQLKVFLNNYLVKLRIYKRYDAANSFYGVNDGYVLPEEENLEFFNKIFSHAPKITQKKPNYVFMRYMFRRSFKRLTIRIRSKIAAVSGVLPLFRHNLMATDACSPMNLKKRFMNKGNYYLLQPNVDFKVKSKFRIYISALKRTYGYSAAYHTNAKLYYFSPYNLFLKKFDEDLLPEEDIITKYKSLGLKKSNHD